jgi:hypothetical protein
VKIRTGFVSNSSSSSFIVGFYKDRVPKSKEDVQMLLFVGIKEVQPYDHAESSERCADRIWEDLNGQKPMTANQVVEQLDCEQCGGPSSDEIAKAMGVEDRHDLGTVERNRLWEQIAREQKKFEADYATKLLRDHPDKVFFAFNYGDENGPLESVLEHGEVFACAPFHLRISRH